MMKSVKRAHVVLDLVWESVQFAMFSLRCNKFRTLLSLLGISIGVFSIVLVLAVTSGLKGNIRKGLDSLGGNTITIQREPWDLEDGDSYAWWELLKRPPVVVADYEFMKDNSECCGAITYFTTFTADVNYLRSTFSDGNIVPVAPDFDKIFAIGVDQGRWFLPEEADSRQGLCFLGADIAQSLFKGSSPVGNRVKVGRFELYVIGVALPQGESIATVFDIDHSVFVPLDFGVMAAGSGNGGAIAIAPKEGLETEEVIGELRFMMRSCRGLEPSEEDDFSINRMSYLAGAVDDVFQTINLVGWIIGGFALLIGAFGIANIMFVSVRERMSQIGIQKALGAPEYIIMTQFLSEAGALSIIGGGLGILIVVIISLILGSDSQVPFELTIYNVAGGMGIAFVTGILSGVMPAWSAAKMDPVKAMNK